MAAAISFLAANNSSSVEVTALGTDALVFVGLLIICLLGSHAVIKLRFTLLPESSVAIVVGGAFGAVLSQLPEESSRPFWTFSPNVFFYVLLPPIIFDAGYSLKRRLFLCNLGAILMYAVVGTVISTVVIAGVLVLGGMAGWVEAELFGGVTSVSGVHASLLFASLISAVDPVATLAVLASPSVAADTTLQAILFGESVLNDAVAIVLYQTLLHAAPDAFAASAGSAMLTILGDFVLDSLGATATGFGVALSLSFVFRHGTLYEESSHIEVALTVCAAYLAYVIAECFGLSGVLSLFFSAVALGHYNWC